MNTIVKKQLKTAINAGMVVIFGAMVVAPNLGSIYVSANTTQQIQQYKEQIAQLQNENAQIENADGILELEASSLADAINKLQQQIDTSQARINELTAEVENLKVQIKEAEIELAKQKKLLGESIKAMYVSGEISTVEMLATSKDLSDFFDKQQYQESVRSKIKTTLDKVTQLKLDLTTKRSLVEATLLEQQALQKQILAQQAEKDRVLTLNQSEQNELESKILQNSSKLAELKKKQAAAEAALANSLSKGSYRVSPVGPVGAGEVVGSIGSTGLSSGPHLHLEVRTASGVVNPLPYITSSPVNMPPAWISQGYGVSNPLYYSGYHRGIDYAASGGGPIFAIDSGMLYRGCSNAMLGTYNNDYGYVAIIEHANGSKSVYAHMSGGPAECNYNTYY